MTAGSTSWASPAADATLSGTVSLLARSSDTTVQFSLDSGVLATETVSGGYARLSQSTTAFTNGSHQLTAEGCTTDVLGMVACDSDVIVVTVDNTVQAVTGGNGTVGSKSPPGSSAPSVPLADGTVYSDVDSFAVGGSGYGLVKITPVVAASDGHPGALHALPLTLPLTGLTGRLAVTACPTTAGGDRCTGSTTQQTITVLSTAPVLTTPAAAVVGPLHPLAFAFTLAVAEPVALTVTRGGAVFQRAIGTFPAGRSTYSWDGRVPGGMPDGLASAQLTRLGGGGVSVARRVAVELHRPAITRVRAARSFAPGAGHAFRAAVTTDRASQARLQVSRGGHLVTTTAWTTMSSTPVALWSGLVGGRRVPGSYRYVVQLRDGAGNTSTSRPAAVSLL